MIEITLPDGSKRPFDHPVTVQDVAASIGAGLAKATLAGKVDGRLVDASFAIGHDASVQIVTEKSPEALEILRHSTAHLMGQAVQRLFPGAQVTIGPVIDNGFYYDFAYERPFTPEDLPKIEAEMYKLVAEQLPVTRSVKSRDEAVAFFRGLGESYKAEIIQGIPAAEDLSLYSQGEFTDLCRGPHVPNTGKLHSFKLMKVAGAYWRGDSSNAMLSRIYGTAWLNDKDLKAYLYQLEEAEKRDHRKLGKQLDLFHQQEESPGMVFWHPNGWAIWQQVEQYMRGVYRKSGYQEVRCPMVLDVSLWKKSGHWDNYKENMFFTESEKHTFALKPMNCPGHVQIFNEGLRSYRDLPLRYGEFGGCHRNEPSGALHGIMRVRAFTQDDGHIFCTPGQIESEVTEFHRQAMQVYADFGFNDIDVALALRPDKRIGDDDVWDRAEAALRGALSAAGVKWTELPGEGAFYGPKIEYHMKDSIGRDWQVGTMQVDFMMPERLGAEYVDEHSQKRHPVMLHRAIVGSMERFIGILIEHHAGLLPAWLAPLQAVVLSITDAQADYVREVTQALVDKGFRVQSDLRNEKVGYKIREHTLQKVPYLLVVGDRERETGAVSVRTRSGEDLGSMPLAGFVERLETEIRR
ncbi:MULTISPECIES: threonine--tRNA ligase [Rhodanobacter]|uniref:threonine--tRNA ligase n=1 Tax=Rhodanobacter TaxID=75309 RepID=UPI00040A5B32|nr:MULTISPECIES: threonine--tRNA ligase [Rhodanobacter]UJJ52099.1 threonine--tRNA ligase [Rhodanobacter denitrificans]UJM94845.1 threonine--tRNA ligase [Rhodanobacter denitrificans]UJM98375.1 threonine--tRNA ligase [Rhodanobacter denitrificans]UJN22212.1 threonine--tRNA ligase [Rhodanobacter denitrificans]